MLEILHVKCGNRHLVNDRGGGDEEVLARLFSIRSGICVPKMGQGAAAHKLPQYPSYLGCRNWIFEFGTKDAIEPIPQLLSLGWIGSAFLNDPSLNFQNSGKWYRQSRLRAQPLRHHGVRFLFACVAEDVRVEQEDVVGHACGPASANTCLHGRLLWLMQCKIRAGHALNLALRKYFDEARVDFGLFVPYMFHIMIKLDLFPIRIR
ncbi:hypothetical protein N183_17490 [Sinorhizobium sp. Sb3]|nr:hypothetical protein N183_17490 [Sinorhizobium sp. Sb3]